MPSILPFPKEAVLEKLTLRILDRKFWVELKARYEKDEFDYFCNVSEDFKEAFNQHSVGSAIKKFSEDFAWQHPSERVRNSVGLSDCLLFPTLIDWNSRSYCEKAALSLIRSTRLEFCDYMIKKVARYKKVWQKSNLASGCQRLLLKTDYLGIPLKTQFSMRLVNYRLPNPWELAPSELQNDAETSASFLGHFPLLLGATDFDTTNSYIFNILGIRLRNGSFEDTYFFLESANWPNDIEQAVARAYAYLSNSLAYRHWVKAHKEFDYQGDWKSLFTQTFPAVTVSQLNKYIKWNY